MGTLVKYVRFVVIRRDKKTHAPLRLNFSAGGRRFFVSSTARAKSDKTISGFIFLYTSEYNCAEKCSLNGIFLSTYGFAAGRGLSELVSSYVCSTQKHRVYSVHKRATLILSTHAPGWTTHGTSYFPPADPAELSHARCTPPQR